MSRNAARLASARLALMLLLCALPLAPGPAARGASGGATPPTPSNPSGPPPAGSVAAGATPDRPFGFRGDGTGRFPGANPPTHWSRDKNIRWSTVVGTGYASPVLAGDWVVVASEPDLLVCLNRSDGKERWRLKTRPDDVPDEAGRKAAAAYEPPHNGSGLAAATPVTDGRTIYAVFANGIVRAVGADGKPVWAACIDAPPNTAYGRAASPLLLGGKLIVHMTGLFAFDAATGKPLWTNADAKSTYATPVALRRGAEDLIVTPAGDVVRAADGKTLATGIGAAQQASPIVGPDGVTYFPSDAVSAVRLGPDFKDEELWNGPLGGDTFGSPVLAGDTLFIVTGDGKLFAFDAGGKGSLAPLIDGRALLEGGASPVAFSSLTLAGNYLFLCSNTGETVVLEATREAKEVARNRLAAGGASGGGASGGGASPVFAGSDLFLRDGDRLVCVRE